MHMLNVCWCNSGSHAPLVMLSVVCCICISFRCMPPKNSVLSFLVSEREPSAFTVPLRWMTYLYTSRALDQLPCIKIDRRRGSDRYCWSELKLVPSLRFHGRQCIPHGLFLWFEDIGENFQNKVLENHIRHQDDENQIFSRNHNIFGNLDHWYGKYTKRFLFFSIL